jgi:hypothetical protein
MTFAALYIDCAAKHSSHAGSLEEGRERGKFGDVDGLGWF